MPRVKPNLVPAYPIHSLEDVDSGLARIAALKRQIDLINLSAAERMDEIKTGAAADFRCDGLLQRRGVLCRNLELCDGPDLSLV